MRMRSLLFLPLAALAATLVRPAAAAVVVDAIVAVVNGEIITLLQLEKAGAAAVGERLRTAAPGDREQVRREVLRPILEQLVLERLEAQRARELGIHVSEQEVDAAIAGIRADNRLSEEVFERMLRERGMTLDDLRAQIETQILHQKLVRQEVGARVTVSDEEIATYYAEHRQEWRRPEKIRIRHLLVPLPGSPSPAEVEEARARAAALRARAVGGADFADLVRAETPGAAPGVDPISGEILRGELFPALEEAAFALPVGGISEPVRGPAGFHLVQLAEQTPAYEPSLEEMRANIEQTITDRKMRERLGGWIQQLRADAVIEIRY